jgi:hypothetical protein
MTIYKTARKHNISDEDITFVYNFAVNSVVFPQEPDLVMLFGYDTIGRRLEVGYITTDQGEDLVIHAMKVRPGYKKYLYGKRGRNDNERK